jgi:DNA-binding XRE family transcriptional regulator
LGAGQADELRKKTVDEYRSNHHLLTSAEIIARRTALGMSQQAFADFIDVGVASVKRWESGFVQEPIYDKRIREKCDSNTFPYCYVALVTVPPVIVCGEFSLTTQVLNVTPYYTVQPVGISPNVSRFTSRMTGDDRLAEVSKSWRKKHSNSFDTDIIRCQ